AVTDVRHHPPHRRWLHRHRQPARRHHHRKGAPLMTTRRTLDSTFTDTGDLPMYLPGLPAGLPAALRRYSALNASGAVGGPVSSVANLGSAPGALVSASGGQSPTLR